jgi:microcin C transport system permease protein
LFERLITNPLTLKRWRRFKSVKRSVFASWLFIFLLILSLTAEFWANDKPILMSYNGSYYLPIFRKYHPSLFNQEGFITNYRALNWQEEPGNWALWPPIHWNPFESNTEVTEYPAPPSSQNIFGTDDRGRDVLARLIYGFRYSIVFALMVWLFSYLMGIVAGAIMGFTGGLTDLLGQRVVEIFESMPMLLILITLTSIFGANLKLLIIFSALFGWMFISLYMRAEFLKFRKRDFVDAARAMGASRLRLIFIHILPNALGPVLTFTPFALAGAISTLAALDYLGFGLPPPTPSWGELLNQAQKYFTTAWWLAFFPSMALFITLVSLNLIGEGVRDAFDPRK